MIKKLLLLNLFYFGLLLQSCSLSDKKVSIFSEVIKGEEFVTANNKFAFDVFRKISKKEDKENYMISPVSLSLSLGMAYNGAENKTKDAFKNTLNYSSFLPEEINTINKEIIRNLTNNSTGSLLEIANSIWIDDSFPLKESFITTNKDFYFAEVEKLDFSDTNSVNIINNWVSDKTYQKIPKIINKINANDVLFLINATYFKSDWKYNFKEKDTKELPFYGENKTENVKTMHIEKALKFYENTTFTAVKLPYKNNKYSMTLLLPKAGKKINDISNLLDTNNWKNWNTHFSEKEIQLALPKFTFSYEKLLNNTLSDLGLGIAFESSANFSSISNLPVSISFVLQKTFIEVNEKGTEAAAVTSIGIGTTSANLPSILKLNKPFLFVITEKETSSISFIGKVGMPKTN